MFALLGLTIPVLLIVNFLASNASRELLVSLLGTGGTDILHLYLVLLNEFLCNLSSFTAFQFDLIFEISRRSVSFGTWCPSLST